jgi:recombination protein RecA
LAPPFKEAQFEIIYGQGISKEGELIDLGTTCNIVGKSGTWYSYQDDRLGQGKENAKNFLKENPKIATEIEKKIKDHLGLSTKEKKSEKKEVEK